MNAAQRLHVCSEEMDPWMSCRDGSAWLPFGRDPLWPSGSHIHLADGGEPMTTATEARPVLVVSNDPDRAEHIAEALRNEGGVVTTESRGPVAAAAIVPGEHGSGIGGAEPPGLLVLDLSLPELDLQRLREALG